MRRTLLARWGALVAVAAAVISNTAVSADTGPVTLASDGYQLGRMSRVALPTTGSTIWITYQQTGIDSKTNKNVYLPALVGYDSATGRVVSGPTQIASDTYTDVQDHNFSSIFNLGNAGYLVAYDAADPYTVRSAPPAGWACLSSTGGAGTSYACQPFKIASNPATLTDSSTEYHFPGTGISELTGGTLNGITLMAGQVQDGSIYHAGAAAYYAVHDLGGHPVFETQGATSGCTALTDCYDPLQSGVSSATNGEFELAAQPSSNQWYDFRISNIPSQVGTHYEIQAAGAGGNTCLYSDYTVSGDTADSVAKRFRTWWNTYCAYRSNHPAVVITNTATFSGTGWIGIEDDADVHPAATVPATPVTCTTITCTGGLTYNHYLLGSKIKVIGGDFYAIVPYDMNSQNWFASGGTTADAGGWAVFKAVPGGGNPTSTNIWTWTDIAGANSTTTVPAVDPTGNLHRVMDPPSSDPAHLDGNPYVVHNPSTLWTGFPGFIDSYQDEAWPSYTGGAYPVNGAGIDLAIDHYGNLWWAFACQDSNGNSRLCYLIQSGTTKASLGGGFADGVSGALTGTKNKGVASPNVSVDSSGRVHITTLVGTGTEQPWNCGQNVCVLDAVTTPTGTGQTSASWTITTSAAVATAYENQAQLGDSVIDSAGAHVYSVFATPGGSGNVAGSMPQLVYDHGV